MQAKHLLPILNEYPDYELIICPVQDIEDIAKAFASHGGVCFDIKTRPLICDRTAKQLIFAGDLR